MFFWTVRRPVQGVCGIAGGSSSPVTSWSWSHCSGSGRRPGVRGTPRSPRPSSPARDRTRSWACRRTPRRPRCPGCIPWRSSTGSARAPRRCGSIRPTGSGSRGRNGWLDVLVAIAKVFDVTTDYLLGLEDFNAKKRFLNGIAVTKTGWDADDEICCPICGCSVARNDDFHEMRPKHCPDCGTKLVY